MTVALTMAVAAAASGVLVALTRWLAERWNLLDRPNERSSHVIPTPRLGGVAIVLVVATGALLLTVGWAPLRVLTVLALVVACIGAVDDVRPLPAAVRLLVHLAAGLALVWWLGAPTRIDIGAATLSLHPLISFGLGLLWIAWFTNVFNFMDGIDGIAGTQAAVAGVGWLVLAGWSGVPAAAIMAALVCGACLGFLWHNWSPARIFMGDAGSAFLGFVLASLPWIGSTERLLLPAMLCVWPFLFDATYTLLRRAARGERVWIAHRSHLYQRLVGAGWSHARTTTTFGLLAVVGAVAAISMVASRATWVVAAVAVTIASGAAWLVWLVHRVEEARRER